MASHRHVPRLIRVAVVSAATTALAVGMLLPGTAQAAPTQGSAPKTAAEAAEKVEQFGQQLEALTEQVNEAKDSAGKLANAAKKAAASAKTIDAQYQQLAGQVGQIVSAVYKSAPFGEFSAFLSSPSPQDFLDQLSALDRVSARRNDLIKQVGTLKTKADKAKADSAKAAGAANATYAQAKTKYAAMVKQISEYKTLEAKLTSQERVAVSGGAGVSPGNLPAPNSAKAKIAIAAAQSKLGDPYVWAAAGPSSFDCSGLMMYAWGAAGVSLPHSSAGQYGYGVHVPSKDQLAPGDLLFFYSPIHHVGMYVGNGLMIHAPTSGDVVKYSNVDWGNFVGATRLG